MQWATLTAACVLAPLAIAAELQAPLSGVVHGAPGASPADDAPSYRAQLLGLHKSLVSIPSVSGTEGDVCQFLSDYLVDRDYSANIQFVHPRENTPDGEERYNIVAWPGSGVPDPRLLVTTHIDVVPPHIPYGIDDGDVTKDTCIWGRGSVDAKASVAAMVVAIEELLAADRIDPADVMFLFVVGEEVAGDGMMAFSDALQDMDPVPSFEATIFGEPTENKLACGHKGGLHCDISAKGVGGHSGYPWLGKSANEVLVRALARILDTNLGSSERFGQTTVNIGRLDGGVAANVIPESAKAKLMTRVAIGPERGGADLVKARIQEILDEVDDEAFTLECAPGYGFVDCECGVDGFEDVIVNYGTDVPHLIGNHTRYLYGPGTIMVAHGDHENLTVGDLETAVEDYQKLILHALKQ